MWDLGGLGGGSCRERGMYNFPVIGMDADKIGQVLDRFLVVPSI
jgi:hypothetical protein